MESVAKQPQVSLTIHGISRTEEGEMIVQGSMDVEGVPIFAFLVQPRMEIAVWHLASGDLLRAPEDIWRAAQHAILASVLRTEVVESGQGVTPDQKREGTEAWQLGLSHGFAMGCLYEAPQGSVENVRQRMRWLRSLVWPEGPRRLEDPTGAVI